MGRKTVLAGLMLLLLSPLSRSEAVDLDPSGNAPAEMRELRDRSTEDACDCCQKCQAAKRSIQPKEEEGSAAADACKDCCAKCGRTLQPSPEDIPPEVIDRKGAPDIIDKQKQ